MSHTTMKTHKMTFNGVKSSDGWAELTNVLRFEKFKNEHPDLDEDELHEEFYKRVTSKLFTYGEYGSFEIIVDEDFNIVGGRIF